MHVHNYLNKFLLRAIKSRNERTPVYATTKSKAMISDLTPGTFYWFKVVAHGMAGRSPASEFAMGLAA